MTKTKVAPFYLGHGVVTFVNQVWGNIRHLVAMTLLSLFMRF